jgi:multidrug efflux pump subunit AcrA (membrane-fusion protein)
MIGAYVDVSIVGRDVTNALRLPSAALREGSYVLVADSEGLLARRDVSIGWYDQEDVVVVNGLSGGEQVITTAISYPIYGAPVEIVE